MEKEKKQSELFNYYILFFVYAVCIGGYVPYSILYLLNIGISSRIISGISIFIPAVAIIFQPILGRLADRMKNSNIVVSSLIMLVILSIAVISRYRNLIVIIIAMSIITIANGGVYSIIVADSIKYLKKRHLLKKFSLLRLLYSAGYGSISILMTFLLNDNIEMSFNVAIAFGILAVIATQSIDWHNEERKREKVKLLHVLRSRELKFLLLFGFLMSASCSQTYVYLPLLYQEIGISDRIFALSIIIMTASEIPVFLLYSRVCKRLDVYKIMLISLISILVRTIVLAYSGNYTTITISNALNGLGFILIQMSLTLYAKNKVSEQEQSTIQTVITSVILSGARMISSIVVLLLINKHNVKHIQRVNAMYMLVVLVLYMLYYAGYRMRIRNYRR